MTINLDPKHRSRRNISIQGDSGAKGSQAPQAADFSLIVNINGSANFTHANKSVQSGWQSGKVRFETVARTHDWVLESESFYQSSTADPWRRGDLRLIRDNIERSTRFVIGDQYWPAQPLMRAHKLAGLSLTKNFSITPYRTTQPSGYQEFLLSSASTVEIFVNEQLKRTLALGPGTYTVNDLPLANGANDFRLRIVDAYGQESRVDVPIYTGHSLLAQGLREFGLIAGVPSVQVLGAPSYDVDNSLISGFYRTGLSETVTLGLAGEVAAKSWIIGTQSALATQLGNFVLNFSAGRVSGGNSGITTQLGYRLYQALGSGRGERIWDFSAVRMSKNYLRSNTGPVAPASHNLALRMTQPLNARSHISLSVNQKSSANAADIFSTAVSFAYRMRSGLTIRVSGSKSSNSVDSPGDVFSLSYSYPFGNARQNIQGSFDSRNNRRGMHWQLSPARSDFGTNAALSYTADKDARFLDGLLAFRGDRFDASINHKYVDNIASNTGLSAFTRLNFSTALVMAGGALGVTRHVADSFAIVVPHENYTDFQIGLKARNSSRETTNGILGSAVTGRLTSYELHQLEVNVDNLPLGYDLHNTNPTIKPKYRSGVVIPVGNAASVILRGQLLARDGVVLELRSGILHSVGDEDGKPIRFFTNRQGKFTVSGLRPGQYKLLLDGFDRTAVVVIPANSRGVFNCGRIQL